jgi:hypothetical protein
MTSASCICCIPDMARRYALCGGDTMVMERSQQFFDKADQRPQRRHRHILLTP